MKTKRIGRILLASAVAVVLVTATVLVPLLLRSTKSATFEQRTPTDKDVIFERVVMQTAAQGALGTSGAGCQWPVSLESSRDVRVWLACGCYGYETFNPPY